MKIIDTTFERLPRERLVIGFEGENLRATVRIDCSSVFAEYPNATPALIVKPLFADAYPVVVDRNGTDVDWLITSEILSFSGDGEIQLVFYKDQVICKSAVSKIRVSRSLQVTGEMPDPVVQWIENANRKLAEVDAQIVELEGMVDTATDAATRAEQSESNATTSAANAATSAATASAKAAEAQASANTATAKAAESALSATQASNSAMSAANSESGATAKAAEAAQSAQTAAQKAEQITEAAQIATGKAEEASASATAAQASATNAASSATAASASETAAKASETAAGASATQAAQSAQSANTAAQTATQKAAEATQSATDAARSATNAATSAETASTKAGEAAQSAQAVEETAEQLAESLEQISQNTADIAEHEQAYNALKAATLIHNTASGAIASFVDGAEMPVDEVTAQINPVQDLHGYDNPWPAGGGKNKFKNYGVSGTESNVVFTVRDDGTVNANGTASGSVIFTLSKKDSSSPGGVYCRLSDIGIEADKTYVLNGCSAGSLSTYVLQLLVYGSGQEPYDIGSGSAQFSFTADDIANKWYRLAIRIYNGTQVSNLVFKPMIRLASETDGTFAPYSNICPISGWDGVEVTRTGKNLLENELTTSTVNGTSFTVNADGSITVSGTPTAQTRVAIKRGLAWDGREVAVFSFGTMPTGTRVFTRRIYNGTQDYPTISPSGTMTIGAEIYDIYLEINTSFNGTAFAVYPQLELGSTATDYEPYQGETYDIAFPTEAGTVYGGSLSIAEDGSGQLVVDRAMVDMPSDIPWNTWGVNYQKEGITGFYIYRNSMPSSMSYFSNLNVAVKTNLFPISSRAWGGYTIGYMTNASGVVSNWYEIVSVSNSSIGVLPTDTSEQAITKFKEFLASTQLKAVYSLIEPQTYTLTASQITTLLGENNLWHDANGDISVGYKANTKLYIDGKIAELVAQIVNS